MHVEAGLRFLKRNQGLDENAGAGQQHEGSRNLGDGKYP